MKTDNKGQSSAELILIIGGLIVIILFIGTYISNITDTTQNKLKTVITKERNFLINKILLDILEEIFSRTKKVTINNNSI